MLKSLRCWPLLSGYRGRPTMDIDSLTAIIVQFSTLIVEQSAILEADINPLLVASGSIVALDARFLIASAADAAARPYAHLAILPTEAACQLPPREPRGIAIHAREPLT